MVFVVSLNLDFTVNKGTGSLRRLLPTHVNSQQRPPLALTPPHSRRRLPLLRHGTVFVRPILGAAAVTCALAPSRLGPTHRLRTPVSRASTIPAPEKLTGATLRLRSAAGGWGGGCGGREVEPPRKAGSRSYAEGARRRGGPEPASPAPLPQQPKENFAAPSAALHSPRLGSWTRSGRQRALLRQGLATSPGAGPRRHGLIGAGAGRGPVRSVGGAARPRRSLL